jgi:hypothetical protein
MSLLTAICSRRFREGPLNVFERRGLRFEESQCGHAMVMAVLEQCEEELDDGAQFLDRAGPHYHYFLINDEWPRTIPHAGHVHPLR